MANHEEQDRQSLMLHTEAVRMMQEDPALIALALSILERWERMESKPHPSHVEWRRILLERDWDTALSTSEFGNQIRQSSPVGCVLPEEKRLEIIWECRGDKSKFTKEEWFQQIHDGISRMAVDKEYHKLMGGDFAMSRNRFFTADHHFGHTNILKYEDESRRNAHGGCFQCIEKMDEYLIDQWNAAVAPGDLVYCLGDFSYKQYTMEATLPYLHGEKILIVGNHDPYFKRLTCAMPRMHKEAQEDALHAGFSAVHLQLDIEIAGIGQVRLSHFPYWPSNVEDEPEYNLRNKENRPPQGREALLLHGHIHSQWLLKKENDLPPMLNVGVDVWEMRPVLEAEIVEKFREL